MAIQELSKGQKIQFEYNGKIRVFLVDIVNTVCDTVTGWQIEGRSKQGRQFTFSKMQNIVIL